MLLHGLLSARGWGNREVFVDGVAPVRLLGLVVSESPQTSEKHSPTHPQGFLRCTDWCWELGGRQRVETARTCWAGCPDDLGMNQSGPQLTLRFSRLEQRPSHGERGVCHLGRGHLRRVCSLVFVLMQQINFL